MGKRGYATRRRLGLVVGLFAILCSLLGVMSARAATLDSGSVGDFEDDGNLVAEPAVPGALDWGSLDTTSANFTRVDDDTIDSGYQGTSKENSPEGFVCNTGGASPGKNNILRAYVNTRITGPADQNPTAAFLDLAFVRAAGNGDAHVNFEFNRNAISNPPCPYIGRTTGDLLLTFDYPGGSGTATVAAFRWDASLDSGLGDWVEFALPASAAAGTTNSGTVSDPIAGGSIAARRFGEATVDLFAFQNATESDLLTCPGLGHINIRSRSSGESFDSALQDRLPEADVNLSTCGSITLKKVDENGKPLAGAQFGLFDNADGDGTPVATCISGDDGLCKMTNIVPGKYWVKEISAPTGYAIDDTSTREVNVAAFQNLDLTSAPFTDTFLQGFVQINKVLHDLDGKTVVPADDSVLQGTTFVVYQDANNNGRLDSGEESKLTNDDPATCTIETGSGCVIGPLAAGDYRVAETVAPPDSTSAGDIDFSITQGDESEAVVVNYVNILSAINISLDKSAAATANVGDIVTYSFDVTTTGPRLHDISLEELVAVCQDAPEFKSGDDGDEFLEVGETWHYECSHEVVMGDGDQIDNTAKVTGTDDYGRTTSNTDTASVTVLHPDVTVTKEAEDALIGAGDTASYTVTVHVGGDEGAVANDVAINDPLPAGLTWTDDSEDCSVANQTLTCDFGQMAEGETASVTVSAETSSAVCGDLVNTASGSASNEKAADQENNSSDPVTIHVSCLAIEINKDGPELAHVGDTITYTLDVTNSGKDDLVSVVVTDPVCDADSLKLIDDADGDTVLSVNETWKYTCTHVVVASDPDPLPNTATVLGKDVEGRETTSSDSHSVDIIHPAITIDKTATPLSVEPGQDVTYSYLVTNTGDTTLTNVKVTDDKLGDIGTIVSLAPGESQTLTKTVTVNGDSPTDNVGTASGTDELGLTVTATDTAHIDIVLPLVLARTGLDARLWVELGAALIMFGFLVLRVSSPRAAAATVQGGKKIKVHRRPQ